MGTRAPDIKAALVSVCRSLFPDTKPTLTTYGLPGSYQPDEIVAVTNIRTAIERPVMGPNRTREEAHAVTVVISVWSAGTETVQQAVTERAYAMVGTFADYFRTSPNETLGGVCREAWVSEYDLTERITYDVSSGAATGREAEIVVTVLVRGRV